MFFHGKGVGCQLSVSLTSAAAITSLLRLFNSSTPLNISFYRIAQFSRFRAVMWKRLRSFRIHLVFSTYETLASNGLLWRVYYRSFVLVSPLQNVLSHANLLDQMVFIRFTYSERGWLWFCYQITDRNALLLWLSVA